MRIRLWEKGKHSYRLVRGGGWVNNDAAFFRAALLFYHEAYDRDVTLSMRLVRRKP